jgi:hypothetical protein
MAKAKVAKAIKEVAVNSVRFVVNKDNTITDKKTGLLIIRDPSLVDAIFKSTMTFDAAIKAIANLNANGYAGHKDWRLPSVEEICGMVDRTKSDPCYDTKIFKGKFNNWYWSGETCAWNSGAAWCVSSGLGYVGDGVRDDHNCVRPVRSSQCQFDHLPVR